MDPFAPWPPEDLEAFWAGAIDEARRTPLEYRRSGHSTFDHPHLSVESLTFSGMGGRTLHGWIATPPGARRLPGFLWIPPYGRESVLPNEYGTRSGMVSLSFNFHELNAFHQEGYVPERGYFSEGAGNPATWIFRRMLQDAYLALRVLRAQPEADEDRLAACGMSQGGGISIWLGAWSGLVRAVCADMPFLGAMRFAMTKAYRYPLKELADFAEREPLGEERLMHTLSYFDTVNQATRCGVPTLVTLGEKDPAVRPEQAEAVYQALPGEKRLIRYPGGHDWHAEMVENNRSWMTAYL